MFTIKKAMKFWRRHPYHLSKRQKFEDNFEDSFELLPCWISLAFLWITSRIILEGTARKTHNKGFLSSRCSICHLWYCLFIRPTCGGRGWGEVMEFSKLWIPFFAFKFPTWHKRSWLPAYITRPQEDNLQNVFGIDIVSNNNFNKTYKKILDTRDHDCQHTLPDRE